MSFMAGDPLLLLLVMLLLGVCFVDLWHTQHVLPAGARDIYSWNDVCSSKCVQ